MITPVITETADALFKVKMAEDEREAERKVRA